MKKIFCIIIALITLCSCNSEKNQNKYQNISEVDMTQLSFGMLSGQIHDMTINPENYTDKTIKANGIFTKDENSQDGSFSLLVIDDSGCCALTINCMLSAEDDFSDDSPRRGDIVTVLGDYESYEDNEYPYFRIANAKYIVEAKR